MINIKNRLEKLEKNLNIGGDFCDCFEIHFNKVLDLVYSDEGYSEQDACALESDHLPEGTFCDKCQKPLSETTLMFNRNLVKVYGDVSK